VWTGELLSNRRRASADSVIVHKTGGSHSDEEGLRGGEKKREGWGRLKCGTWSIGVWARREKTCGKNARNRGRVERKKKSRSSTGELKRARGGKKLKEGHK